MAVEIKCPKCQQVAQTLPNGNGGQQQCENCGTRLDCGQSAQETLTEKTAPRSARAVAAALARPKRLGRFEVRGLLGRGSFGEVYRAYDPILEREVALKLPAARTMISSEARARILREPKAAAQLRHPNIVPVFDAGTEGDRFYIASALIEGDTLERAVRVQRVGLRDAAQIVRKLAGALHYAHGQGIVHRDVKPGNVMIDAKGEPHLLDFGLAQWTADDEKLTQDGSLLGTPAYMSPEQAGAPVGEVGPASDQYSLGVVLYELLAGEVPFSGAPLQVLYQIRQEEPSTPRSKNPQVPRDLETICLKAMAKRPSDRYATCEELANDLGRWIDDEPIQARRVRVPERAIRWSRRNPMLAAMCVAVVLLAMVSTMAALGLQVARTAAERHAIMAQQELEARRAVEQTLKQRELDVQQKDADLAKKAAELGDKVKLLAEREATLQRMTTDLEQSQKVAVDRQAQLTVVEKDRDTALKAAPFFSYAKNIESAQQRLLGNDKAGAIQSLNDCPAELRGWEWRVLDQLSKGLALDRWQRDFAGKFELLELSPEGKLVVLATIGDKTKDGIIPTIAAILDADSGQTLLTNDDKQRAQRNPTGRRTDSGQTLLTNDDKVLSRRITNCAFDPTNRVIALGNIHGIQLFSLPLGSRPPLSIRYAAHIIYPWTAFNLDGSELYASVEDAKGCVVYETATGKALWRSEPSTFIRPHGIPWAARFIKRPAETEKLHVLSGLQVTVMPDKSGKGYRSFPCPAATHRHLSNDHISRCVESRFAMHPSKAFAVAGNGAVIHLTDFWYKAFELPMSIRPVAFNQDGSRLAAIDELTKQLVILDTSLASGEWRQVAAFDKELVPVGDLFQLSRDWNRAITVLPDGTLCGWSIK